MQPLTHFGLTTLSQRAQAALQAVNALHGGGMGSMAIPTDPASIAGAAAQSPVLRVIVENLFYPVTLEVLHQVKPCFCLKWAQAFWLDKIISDQPR